MKNKNILYYIKKLTYKSTKNKYICELIIIFIFILTNEEC